MSPACDVAIAGLGAAGSAAADALARRGLSVMGFDRFDPPHDLGSSHGETRIIREAYFEHPVYVPLVQRAYENWAALERDTGRTLMRLTGGLMIGDPSGVLVSGAQRSAEVHGLPFEILDSAEVRRRFPVLTPPRHMVAVWERRAGVLFPESCVAAQLERAVRHGAALHTGEPVESWRADGEGVEITTTRGRYRAAHLLLSAGAWNRALLGGLALPLTVARQVAHWFTPARDSALFEPGRFPIWICEHEPGRFFYGFPAFDGQIKVARHHEGELTDPLRVRREVSLAESDGMRELIGRFLPAAGGALHHSSVCLYTNTPDDHFVLDRHPGHSQVVISSACSGHGFKFASALGEVLADLLIDGRSRYDLEMFRATRFASA
jgi:sarcosine oxidase